MSFVAIIGNLGFIVSAASLLMRDMLLLREVSLLATSLAIVYYVIVPGGPIWISVIWNALFLCINAVQIAILFRERRRVLLNDEERELYETLFPTLMPVQFMKLMRLGQWRSAAAGEWIARSGDAATAITLIARGEADVLRDGTVVRQLGEGAMIGEIAYVAKRPFTADIRLSQPSRLVTWAKADLDRLLSRNPTMTIAMEAAFIIGLEMAPAQTRGPSV